jgi:hypothetical protein
MSVSPAPHIIEAVIVLNKRLLPAKMKQNFANSKLLFDWLSEEGLNPMNMSSKGLADAMETVIKKHIHDGLIDWTVKPAILRQRIVEKVENPLKLAEERAAQLKAVDAATAKSMEDEACQKRINALIEGAVITNADNRGISYGKTGAAKDSLRKLEKRLKAGGTPLQMVETKLRNRREELYREVERNQAQGWS